MSAVSYSYEEIQQEKWNASISKKGTKNYAMDSNQLVDDRVYSSDVHSFIWRKQANSELTKSFMLSKENIKVDDICFTVDVYKFNNQELNEKFVRTVDLDTVQNTKL